MSRHVSGVEVISGFREIEVALAAKGKGKRFKNQWVNRVMDGKHQQVTITALLETTIPAETNICCQVVDLDTIDV